MRRDVLYYLFGVESSKNLNGAQVAAVLEWIADDKDPVTGDYPLKEHAQAEANAIFTAQMKAAGQGELL